MLDGLRGFAIISVLYAHSFSSSSIVRILHLEKGGFIGVDIFFVLSSFLISTLLLKEYLNFGNISIKQFYIRRSIRLFPPLLLATIIFIPILLFIDWRIAIRELFYIFTYSANIARSLVNFIPSMFQPNYFAHTWSLATEEQFYLVFPFIFLYSINKKINFFKKNYSIIISIFFIFITAPILKPLLKDGICDFPLWRFGEFLIGFITALIYANIMYREEIIKKTSFLSVSGKLTQRITSLIRLPSLSFICFCLLFLFIFYARINSYFTLVVVHPMTAFVTAILILQITIAPNRVIKYFLGSTLLVEAGIVSYGLYVYHYPILMIESWLFNKKFALNYIIPFECPYHELLTLLIEDGLWLVLTLLVTYFSSKIIERPILKYKANFSRN